MTKPASCIATLPRRRMILGGLASGVAPRLARAERVGEVEVGLDGWLFAAWEDIRALDAGRMRQTIALVSDVVAGLRRAGIHCVLTLAPTRARIYADKLPAGFRASPSVDQRYAAALRMLRDSGALVPDLATPMADLRHSEADNLFFKTDSHWTPAATEPLAVLIAQQMQAHFPMEPTRQPGTRLGALETRTHPGDLLATLPPPARASYPATEIFRIHKALTPPPGDIRAGLLDEDGADIAIVGNSYMLPYFGLPPMLSNRLNRPLSLFWRTARVGPWQTLLQYLASDLYRQRPPKILILHLMEGSLEFGPSADGWWGADNAMPVPKFSSALHRSLGG